MDGQNVVSLRRLGSAVSVRTPGRAPAVASTRAVARTPSWRLAGR